MSDQHESPQGSEYWYRELSRFYGDRVWELSGELSRARRHAAAWKDSAKAWRQEAELLADLLDRELEDS